MKLSIYSRIIYVLNGKVLEYFTRKLVKRLEKCQNERVKTCYRNRYNGQQNRKLWRFEVKIIVHRQSVSTVGLLRNICPLDVKSKKD